MISKDIVNDIRQEIATVLATSTIFQAVSAYPKASFSGFPAAMVMPSENQADYGSTVVDRFVFVFDVYIFYPMNKEADQEKTETAIGEAIGETLRIFSPKRPGPMTTCDWVEPVPSTWADITVGEQPYRMGTVTLKCVKYVDTQ